MSRHEIVDEHPDTGHSIQGLVIPHWETLLDIAARCQELTGLGYLGVDLVLDQDQGPLLLELNARPGLAIQIANAAGLMHRVKLVEAHIQELPTANDRIAFARAALRRQPGNCSLKAGPGFPWFAKALSPGQGGAGHPSSMAQRQKKLISQKILCYCPFHP